MCEMKDLLRDILNKAAVINHAEIGLKKEKGTVTSDASERTTPTQDADQVLKKYKKKFMI